MSGPVAKLMQRGRVVAHFIRKLRLQRQIDGILSRPVERAGLFSVDDLRSGSLKELLRSGHIRPPLRLLRCEQRLQAFNLVRIEHVTDETARALQLHLFLDRISIRIPDGLAVVAMYRSLLLELPVNNRSPFLALPDLCSDGLRLTVRHPSGVSVTLHHEVQHVAAAIRLARRRIHGA